MNNSPVGIFDSGIGGLTVMAEVMRRMPGEDIIYFGDTAHVPYGSKSPESVKRFSLEIASFLNSKKVKMIIIACNTASAFALESLRGKFNFPVLGVIEPGARAALDATKTGRIGVIGTDGTVKSKSYHKAIANINGRTAVFSKSCPLLVPLVEEGWLDHDVTASVAREYLSELKSKKIDTLVLGCTHYPLVKKIIGNVIGPDIKLIDSATATAKEAERILLESGLSARAKRKAVYRFFVSDAPDKFQQAGQRFLKRKIGTVKKVKLGD